MATEVIMPKVEMVMDTGTFIEWLKHEGDLVSKGEPLFIISTDKAMIECEAPADGVLAGLAVQPNEVIPVSQVIGYILAEAERLPEVNGKLSLSAGRESERPEQALPLSTVLTDASTGAVPPVPQTNEVLSTKARATPVARRLARELGVNLALLAGRGSKGRIHKQDVLDFSRQQAGSAASWRETSPDVASGVASPRNQEISHSASLPHSRPGVKEVLPLGGARRIVAERMVASAFSAPHFTLSVEVDMSEMARAREQLLEGVQQRTGYKLSYTALLARAVAAVLPRYPLLNASLQGQEILVWEDVHLGIATSLDDQLIVPVIPKANSMHLEELVTALNDRVERARARRLTPAEMSGSTFTISNLGMFGVDRFTAIINPPETAILAAGKIGYVPTAVGMELAVRLGMNLTLSIDHRVVDGAYGAHFLAELKANLETPYLML